MSLVQDASHSTSVAGVMKIGNIAPRVGIKPTYLAFWANVLTITLPRLAWLLTREVNADYYTFFWKHHSNQGLVHSPMYLSMFQIDLLEEAYPIV